VDRLKDLFKADFFTANIAADIVVNGIIDDNGLSLPDCAVRDNDLKHLSAREIYSILKQKQSKDKNHLKNKYGVSTVNACLVEPDNDGQGEGQQSGEGEEGQGPFSGTEDTDWKDIMNKAATIARMKKAGPTGAAMERIFKELLEPTIDWRTILYKYITECRNDFNGYDRRFAHQNLYLDDFSGTQVHVLTYIDVSGSIDEQLLTEFISEIDGAINAVTNINGEVHCFDTKLHYVCELENLHTDFKLIGGGGTCFKCIFDHIASYKEEHITSASTILPIILTDGYADVSSLNFPDRSAPLLWVVCPGGVVSDDYFPFGDVTRIVR
jgi:predicted metal-dependent peptidase